jgi:hypothetical protein
MPPSNRVWKIAGIAGLVGVVATGALVARNERDRRAYTPDEVRDRLQERLEEAQRESRARHAAACGDTPMILLNLRPISLISMTGQSRGASVTDASKWRAGQMVCEDHDSHEVGRGSG